MKRPPFCPNRACRMYHETSAPAYPWYRRRGTYTSKSRGTIQRYQCRHCGRNFSSQTFSIDYMTKKKVSYQRILTHLVTSSGIRDMARDLSVAPTTVLNRISRLSRQAVAIHHDLSSNLTVSEALVADGFESFAVSQYFPNNFNLLAGKESQFWYGTEYAHLSRKGAMSEAQKRKNRKLQKVFISGRISIYKAFLRLIERIDGMKQEDNGKPVILYTDEHIQYPRAVAKARELFSCVIQHARVSSKLLRRVLNVLFAVNYLDREIRKDCAEHVRETVKFARNVSNSLERAAIYRLYHNYMKPFRIGEKEYQGVSHGMKAGLEEKEIARQLKTLFTQRRFLYRTAGLPMGEALVWLRGVATPLKRYAEYVPGYAWQ